MIRSDIQALTLVAALCAATPAHGADWGGIFSALTLVSDYRYQGVSSTNGGPALQGYAHWHRPDNAYLGVFATQIDYGYPGSPSFEIDLYGGKAWRLDNGRTELKAEAMLTAFPDNRTPGPTFDFVQVKLAASRRAGRLRTGAAAAFVPDSPFVAGLGWRAEIEAAYALTSAVELKALAGRTWVERGQDRTFWEFGASRRWKTLTFQLRYVDTNLGRRRCGFNPDICGATLVGGITAALPPIL